MELGLYQCQAGALPAGERLSQIETCLKDRSLDLLLCPELFTSGYADGPALREAAEAADGPFGRQVAALARSYGTAIAYGYPEQDGAHLFNSAALYDASGALIATHRKRLPSPGSFEEVAFAPGGPVTFADLGEWRVAMVICYEVEFPETLRQAALGGADLVLVPTALGADWGVVAEKVVPTRAYENGIWVAYAGHTGSADGYSFFGGSRICGPDGKERAEAGCKAGLIAARIERAAVRRMQARLPFLRDRDKL